MEHAVLTRRNWSHAAGDELARLRNDEWIVTNGLGGYASGAVLGPATRRYHGLLVAALPTPLGRMMMLNALDEQVVLTLGGNFALGLESHTPLSTFALELGLPVWRYQFEDCVLEKRLHMPHRANSVHVTYRVLQAKKPVKLQLSPALHCRAHEAPVGEPNVDAYRLLIVDKQIEISAGDSLTLRMQVGGKDTAFVASGRRMEMEYSLEHERGYPYRDVLWSPGHFQFELVQDEEAIFSASTESWDALLAVEPTRTYQVEIERRQRLIELAGSPQDAFVAELVLAADQFVIVPTTRAGDEVRAHAAGDEVRSVIAGYHWFTDWGRDTMISLEGLTLLTGRATEAGYILRTFGHHVRDGLLPNLFPEGEDAGLYHTADATLWYFHALDRYLNHTHDVATLRSLLPTLREIATCHLEGTRFGIGVDAADGLLRQGEDGYQLTWMDAKVDGWVVTPRRGKAVEINALWHNALRLLAKWLAQEHQVNAAAEIAAHADRAKRSFNERFWCEERGWLYDVIDSPDGLDASLRPNQLFAISLAHPVLDKSRWPRVLEAVRQHLLTPVGLRTLAPFEADYKSRYFGDLRARDAAYHQGTVWPWLMGAYVDACLKLGAAEDAPFHAIRAQFLEHFDFAGVGTISEIFDAEPPFTPRGCISQAWSVAEVLRAIVASNCFASGHAKERS